MANETASGWTASENWADDPTNADHVAASKAKGASAEPFGGKDLWAYFTYTVSISYAWGRQDDEPEDKNSGFLDDEVVLGIGIDDAGHGFTKARVEDLLGCLRLCRGVE